MLRIYFLLLLLLAIPVHSSIERKECGSTLLESKDLIAEKIASIHRMKGTFERLHPADPSSIARAFPELNARILRFFEDRPSYLMGINRGLPPDSGTSLGQIFQNIHSFAQTIGLDLGYIIDAFPQDYYAVPLLRDYAKRFKSPPPTTLVKKQESFDPSNQDHLNEITSYGKSVVCSLWAELRMSLLIGHLSRVNVTVRELVRDGVISNHDGSLDSYYQQEIDHFWFPKNKEENRPSAVAIGETKVFDKPFSSRSPGARTTYAQLRRYLYIASIVGAQLGFSPQLHYFFVAGISQTQIEKMHRITSDFNESLKEIEPTKQLPVDLFVFGNFDTQQK